MTGTASWRLRMDAVQLEHHGGSEPHEEWFLHHDDGTGTCTFHYTGSSAPGTDTIHATTTFTVNTVSLTRSTLASGSDVHGDGLDVAQTWVDANVSIAASDTNEVGTSQYVHGDGEEERGSGWSVSWRRLVSMWM